jgi:hypothetical protein
MSFQNVLRGAGSILDLWPDNTERYRRIASKTGTDALRQDWMKVGQQLRAATENVSKTAKTKRPTATGQGKQRPRQASSR